MKRLTIEHYKAYGKADFYSMRFASKQHYETDEFISRFVNDLLYQEDLSKIVYYLDKIGREFGSLERFFRPEKGMVKAIPIIQSKLRLYCIRLSDEVLILGNGGVKTSKKIQDSPDLFPLFHDIVQVEKILQYRRRHNEIEIVGRKLQGNLTFNID